LPRGFVRIANQKRSKLIKGAQNQTLVIWGDVRKAPKKALKAKGVVTKDAPMPSEDWLARQVRATTYASLGSLQYFQRLR